ncbi:MAG: hypothetical protein RL189_2136 [Pseudomonadota bacterium]
MLNYLKTLDETPAEARWPLVHSWIQKNDLAFYDQLRRERPILRLPEVTLVSRFDDCMAVLRQHDIFSVALYSAKQAGFWMAEDETALHWREKGLMQAILDFEDLPRIRQFTETSSAEILAAAGGSLDAVTQLSRVIPVSIVQQLFGYDESDSAEILKWSFWSQCDAFHNQPFHKPFLRKFTSEEITKNRQDSAANMGLYLRGLLQRRGAQLAKGEAMAGRGDPASRLLRLSATGALDFDVMRVARNVGALLIGTIETVSQSVIYALSEILSRKDIRSAAASAAWQQDAKAIDGFVFEALRFNPPFPYFFRVCEKPATLGLGKAWQQQVDSSTVVLTLNQSAMFDPDGFLNADSFDANRNQSHNFLFGHGHHQCLGRHIGAVVIPEVVRQVLRLTDVELAGKIDFGDGPFPEHLQLKWKA